jgi:Spy/CpxP family protein refolding chaperone
VKQNQSTADRFSQELNACFRTLHFDTIRKKPRNRQALAWCHQRFETRKEDDMTEEQNDFRGEILPPARSGWSRWLIIGGATAVVVVGAGAAAFASGDGPGHWRGKFMRGFMEYRMDQVLTDAGASAEQKDKIKTLFKTTMDEVRPARGERKEMRAEVMKLLSAPTIDRAAIEDLRAKHVAELDAKSKTIAKAVADAAEILTPDQRKKLVDELDDFGPDHD